MHGAAGSGQRSNALRGCRFLVTVKRTTKHTTTVDEGLTQEADDLPAIDFINPISLLRHSPQRHICSK